MRQALTDLGEALAGQLSDVGSRPTIRREWNDHDQRSFNRQDNVLTVEASAYRSEEALSVPADASEAAIVHEVVVKAMIDQRTRGIRHVWRNALVSSPKGIEAN